MMELVELPQETLLERCERVFKEMEPIRAERAALVEKTLVVDEDETATTLAALTAAGPDAVLAAFVPTERARACEQTKDAYINLYRELAEDRALRFFEKNPDEHVYRDTAIVFRRKTA